MDRKKQQQRLKKMMDYSSSDDDSPKAKKKSTMPDLPDMNQLQEQVSNQFDKMNIGVDVAAGMDNKDLMRLFEQSQSNSLSLSLKSW